MNIQNDQAAKRRACLWVLAVTGLVALHSSPAAGLAGDESTSDTQTLHLCDFAKPADVKAWNFVAGTPRLIDREDAQGGKAMEITFDPAGKYRPAYIGWKRPHRDWSSHDALVLDVYNPNDEPIGGYVLIADRAWADKNRSYWNRHNSGTTFPPGASRWVIPVGGLFRGEAGSRNNDIKRNIDADSIVRVDLGFGNKGQSGRVIIDDLRLVKVDRPDGVWAFDFGPADQSVAIGWTGVTSNTAYSKEAGFGWGRGGGHPWDGAARDTTFGPALIRDFCQAGGYRFRVDAQPGKYSVTLLFENSGYWGGEQATHTRRRIIVGSKEVWSEKRADGPAHALWRFENVEPVGVDLWDTYMAAELARPVRFTATAGRDGLTLYFESDGTWGARVAGMIIHRADDREAARWRDRQLEALAEEFRRMAVCLDAPAGDYNLPKTWRPRRLIAWPVDLAADLTPHSLPPEDAPAPSELALHALAVRGETATFSLAIRSPDEQKPARVSFEWADAAANLPVEISRVWYNSSRGFNTIAYRIRPHTLRPANEMPLEKDISRQLVLRVRVPADARPGNYAGKLTLATAGGELAIPVTLTVSPVVLDRRTEFRMGFFGLMPPGLLPEPRRDEALVQTLTMLRDYGMNMVSGGPGWTLSGWKDGRPLIDFAATDQFMALLAEHGFDGPVNGYGGLRFRGLHDRYTKGATAEKVARDSGLSYEQAFKRAWQAVHQHARANDWPTIWYAMCDETRVREQAERELEFMKLMAEVSAAYPRTVRTSGSYSVHFRSRPTDRDDLLYWHQRFFEALDISSLNGHDPSVLAEAKRLGKQVQIYNQGRTRYSFGLYQFSEFRKGIAARTQWHLNILHGYQFFDLDGREPDNAMLCYGRERLYPTIHFERCRQGAQDFYLYQTLARRVEAAQKAGRNTPAVDAAAKLLASLDAAIALNQRSAPADYDPEALKAKVVAALERLAASTD